MGWRHIGIRTSTAEEGKLLALGCSRGFFVFNGVIFASSSTITIKATFLLLGRTIICAMVYQCIPGAAFRVNWGTGATRRYTEFGSTRVDSRAGIRAVNCSVSNKW
jgi:hypothetical protein